MRAIASFVLGSFLLTATPAAAALRHQGPKVFIQLQSGRVEGELVDTLPDGYLVRIASGRSIKIPFADVVSIQRGVERTSVPVVPAGPKGTWTLEDRGAFVSSTEHSSGVGLGIGLGTAIGAGSSVGGSVGTTVGGGSTTTTVQKRWLIVREDGVRDVPARELIEKSGASDLQKSLTDARDEVRGERVLAHVGYGLLEAAGIAAAVVGAVYLKKGSDINPMGNPDRESEQIQKYVIGSFLTIVGVSITIDTPFRWYARGKELNTKLDDVDRTPYVEAFMKPERARTEVDKHNRALR